MTEPGFHRVADEIAETAVADWAADGVAAIEEHLRRQAAFLEFLESDDAAA